MSLGRILSTYRGLHVTAGQGGARRRRDAQVIEDRVPHRINDVGDRIEPIAVKIRIGL
jgi:hypothetical protein